ncbi:MAG TPA: hypothetical protein VHX62_14850 [Solirubrobacteraceae bacterium]|jgi:hypothetical protein|nr:hypothetical protein [Solirubrobacteraceae bacterium]
MRYVKWLAVVAVLCAYPAVALAHKAPSAGQKTALTSAFDKYVDKSVPAKCLRYEVSTANSAYALVAFATRLPHSCLADASDGVVIFHLKSHRWRFVTAGSSFISGSGKCDVPHVPKNVAADFKLCG